MTVRLLYIVRSKALLHPNQYGSLPGPCIFNAALTLTDQVRILPRPTIRVSTLFLDIKAGFNDVDAFIFRSSLLVKSTPSYMVDRITSFLSKRTCTIVFQGSPNLQASVLVGIP